MSDALEHSALQRWQADPVRFIDEVLRNPKEASHSNCLTRRSSFSNTHGNAAMTAVCASQSNAWA